MTIASVLIKDTLVNLGYTFGGQGDWAIYIGKMPASPIRTITIYDAPGRAKNPAWLLNYPAVQIKVRGGVNDYKVAGDKINEISERLVGKPSYNAIDGLGDRIVSILSIGDYNFLEWNENGQPVWVMNLSMIVEPAAIPTVSQREPL